MKLKQICIAVACVGSLTGISYAGSVGGFGGSTEITQVANNGELLAQVAEASRQTAVQINQYQAMLRDLKSYASLDGIASKMGVDVSWLRDVQNTAGATQSLMRDMDNLKSTANNLNSDAVGLYADYGTVNGVLRNLPANASQNDFKNALGGVLAKPDASPKKKLEIAESFMKQSKDKTTAFSADYNNLMKQSSGVTQITGNVEGLQFLATQNVGIQKALVDISVAINALAGQQATIEANKEAEKLKQDEKDKALIYEKLRRNWCMSAACLPPKPTTAGSST